MLRPAFGHESAFMVRPPEFARAGRTRGDDRRSLKQPVALGPRRVILVSGSETLVTGDEVQASIGLEPGRPLRVERVRARTPAPLPREEPQARLRPPRAIQPAVLPWQAAERLRLPEELMV